MAVSCDCPPEAGSATCELREDRGDELCPSCRKRGKRVDLVTLKAVLSVPLTEIRHTSYLFCRTRDCPVVYFSESGEQAFAQSDVRELVYQKDPDNDKAFVCYCFRHSVESVKEAEGGGTAVLQAITAGIQRGLCACEIRNPQGSCCLGNVRALLASR